VTCCLGCAEPLQSAPAHAAVQQQHSTMYNSSRHVLGESGMGREARKQAAAEQKPRLQ
jgi:hypothetical protein